MTRGHSTSVWVRYYNGVREKYWNQKPLNAGLSRMIFQAGSRQFLTADARVQSREIPCWIVVENVALGILFRVLWFSAANHNLWVINTRGSPSPSSGVGTTGPSQGGSSQYYQYYHYNLMSLNSVWNSQVTLANFKYLGICMEMDKSVNRRC